MQHILFYDVSSLKLIFGPRRAKDAIYFQFTDGPQCIMAFNDRSRGETYFNFPKTNGIREFSFNGVHVVVERDNGPDRNTYTIWANTPIFTSIYETIEGKMITLNYID